MELQNAAVAALVVLSLATAPFAVPVGPESSADAQAQVVPFSDTNAVGVSEAAVRRADRSSLVIPKAEVFYSQYRYVVGYYGITSLVATLQEADSRRSLGRPLRMYVSDFSGANASLTDDNYLRIPEHQTAGWVEARDAYFVVNSSARIPSRDRALVPFSDRSDAKSFAEQYGGEVRRWDDIRTLNVGSLGRSRTEWEENVQQRHERANQTVAARRTLLERPGSVVVGQDAPSLDAAVNQASANTTVVLPPGTYRIESLEIRKPITLRGAGQNVTRIVGDGNGTVVNVTEPEVAIANLSISGVGDRRTGANLTAEGVGVNESDWNYKMRKVHGYGDAAIVFDTAGRSLVSDVTINTTSNGIVARDSPNIAVTNLTLYGTERWDDGFLGVAVIGAPAVVQNSRFYGGKVGVFSLDVAGLVVRNSSAKGMMLGVFNYYGRELLIANNEIDDTGYGIYVEARSYNTAVVGNSITNNVRGIIVAGTANYAGRNVLTKNSRGFMVQGHYSLYTRNVVAFNDIGFRAIEILPTNRVTANDVVNNAEPATVSTFNVLQVWRGNFWSEAPGMQTGDNGRLDREYRPTGAVDRYVGEARAAEVLARSPALLAIRRLQRQVAGLQGSGIVDPAPLAAPVRPQRVDQLEEAYDSPGKTDDDDPWDFQGV